MVTLGLLVDDLLSPYQMRLLTGVRRAAEHHGARVIGFAGGSLADKSDGHNPFDGSYLFDLARAPNVDALIVASTILGGTAGTSAVATLCRQSGVPVVSIGELPGFCSVDAETEGGLGDALEHLIAHHGFWRVGFIRGVSNNAHSRERELIFRNVMARHELPVDERLVLPGDFLETSGARAIVTLAERGVPLEEIDALVAANDQMAAGAIGELQRRGMTVPDDVAVIGFDDDEIARVTTPAISTVAQPVQQIATRATELALKLVSGWVGVGDERLPVRFVRRVSCGCTPAERAAVSTPKPQGGPETLIRAAESAIARELIADNLPARQLLDEVFKIVRSDAPTEEGWQGFENAARADASSEGESPPWRQLLEPLGQALAGSGPAGEGAERRLREVCLRLADVQFQVESLARRRAALRSDAVATLGSVLTSAKNLTSFCSTIETSLPGLDADVFYLCLFDDEGDTTKGLVQYVANATSTPTRLPIARTRELWSILPGSVPPDSTDTKPAPRWRRELLLPTSASEALRHTALVVYPLVFAGEAFGYVVLNAPKDAASCRVVEGLVQHLSTGLQILRNADDLREAIRLAEQANEAKGQFVAAMSHELRTPLTAIMGHIDLSLKAELPSDAKRRLTLAKASSRSLLQIVNMLLDFSRAEANELTPECTRFALHDVLEHVVSACAMAASKKGLEFVVDVDPALPVSLVGDPLRIGQILVNLVSNAIKFTFHGEVVLRLECGGATTPHAVNVEFVVSDTGVGMSPATVSRLFQPFTQGDSSTTRRFGGTGLGLAISERLVQLMGGSLSVSSEEGRGSTFRFALELEGCDDPVRLTDEGKGSRVLVIEDNPTQRDALLRWLHAFGFETSASADGDTAADGMISTGSPPPYLLALVDVTLPDGRVMDVAEALEKTGEDFAGPTVLMLPSHIGSLDVAGQGGVAAIAKPLLPSLLLELLRSGQARRSSRVDPPAQSTRRALGGKRLLVVQDDALTLDLHVELLQSAGATVLTAREGSAGLRLALSENLDAVLLDLDLPVMSGTAVASAIRMTDDLSEIPILGVTARGDRLARQQCLSAGMNDCVATPVDADAFIRTIAAHLTQSRGTPGQGALRMPSSPSQLAIPAIAALNTQLGLARAGGEETRYRRLLQMFRDTHAASEDALRTSLAAEDLEDALRVVHTAAGAAGNVGAMHLALVAQTVESVVRRGVPVETKLLADFGQCLRDALGAVDEYLDGSPSTMPGALPQPELQAGLAELRSLLEAHDTAALELLARLREPLMDTAPLGLVQRLEHLLNGYDFRSALVSVGELEKAVQRSGFDPRRSSDVLRAER